MKSKKSFTLIELLIVIAIIGIIATFIIVSVRSAQSRARDSKRAADLESLNTAIQTYYRATGHFPSLPKDCGNAAGNGVSSNQVTRWATGACLVDNFVVDLVPTYVPSLPKDPGPTLVQDGKAVRGFVYFRANSGGSECYKIVAMNPENPKDVRYQSIWDPARDGGSNKSESDGASPWAWSLFSRGCESK